MSIHKLVLGLLGLALLASSAGSLSRETPDFLGRQPASGFQFRLLSWNVKFGSIYPPNGCRHAAFARIVRAVDPDVLVLQEVDPSEVERLLKTMEGIVPLGNSGRWQIHGAADNAIVSRFPLLRTDGQLAVPYPLPGSPDFHYGHAMALVDLPDEKTDTDVYLVAMHNRSHAEPVDVQQRQVQSDMIVEWLRTLREAGGIPARTPLVVAGDMNVLPGMPARHLDTLLSGDIEDEARFGPDYHPDWDGTGLRDANPSHNARGQVYYTWRDDAQPFPPGQLSHILYTDSAMTLWHAFVLNTVAMSAEELVANGLQREDCLLDGKPGMFDHMPVVADFLLP